MASVQGVPQLQARLHAIGRTSGFMRQIGLRAVREQKLLVRRKTGNLGRSIRLASATETTAVTVATANYAGFVEFGTRAHEITPNAKRALRFAASASGRRLTGSPRTGAAVIFATRVHHPGTKPYPFMLPGAKRAVSAEGVEGIVSVWNSAA